MRRLPLPHGRARRRRGDRSAARATRRRRPTGSPSCGATGTPRTSRRPAGSATRRSKVRRAVPRAATPTAGGRSRPRSASTSPSDIRRCEVMREELGDDVQLMADANQVWDVPEAIDWMRQLEPVDLRWIEEPTSPDDVLGHAAIRRGVAPRRRRHRRARRQPRRSSSSCCRPRRSTTARSTPAGSAGSTRCWRCCCSPRTSACRCARTPAASACARWCSTSRSSTTCA